MDYPDTKLEDNVAASVLSVRPLWSDDISISAEINGEAISFLIDSGSAVLILVESKIEKCFAKKGIVLSQPPETLLDYNRKVIEDSGCFSAFTKVGVTSVEIRPLCSPWKDPSRSGCHSLAQLMHFRKAIEMFDRSRVSLRAVLSCS